MQFGVFTGGFHTKAENETSFKCGRESGKLKDRGFSNPSFSGPLGSF